jgi:16S rRNA (cytosine967-C5)-methyltransferase
VHEDDAYANLITPMALREARLSRSDAGFVTELVYGTLRMQGLYDALIAAAAGRAVGEIDEDVLDVLRLGAHQWLHLHTPAHAAVSETVNLAKSVRLGRSAGFVNAVMRRITERELAQWIERVAPPTLAPGDRLAITYSHPRWIVDDLMHALDERGRAGEIEALLGADNTAATVSLVDLRHARDATWQESTAGKSFGESLVEDERTPFSLNLLTGDPGEIVRQSGGQIRVQDVGSQLAALALWGARDAQAGEKWLDVCAGPGGKAALLAALAERSGAHLVANEMSQHRAKLVSQAVAPFSNVSVTVSDGRSKRSKVESLTLERSHIY